MVAARVLGSTLLVAVVVGGCGWTAEQPPSTSASSQSAGPLGLTDADRATAQAACYGWGVEIATPQMLVSDMEAGRRVITSTAQVDVLQPADAIQKIADTAPAQLRQDLTTSATATRHIGLKMKAWHGGLLDVHTEVPAFNAATTAVRADCARVGSADPSATP